jgi:hypothetical protein
MQTVNWVTSLVAEGMMIALAIIFIRRQLHRRFPFFFAYVLFGPVATALRLSAMNKAVLYYVVYWTTEFVYGLLALLAIMEVFESVLRLFGFDGLGWRVLLPVATFTIAAMSVWRGFHRPLNGQPSPLAHLAAGAYAFEISVHCLQATILLLCLAPRRFYGVLWHYDFSIVAGLGLAGFFTTLADLARFKFGVTFDVVFQYLPAGAYFGISLYWLFVFANPEPPQPRLNTTVEDQLTLVRRVTALLKKYWHVCEPTPVS